MPKDLPHVIILGAGPAGVGAAYQLTRKGLARVTVLEQRDVVGGNAGSFEIEGVRVDYGSHRLHPACDPEILAELRGLLGDDLRDRPRHGRIRLQGRWIHFPLRAADLVTKLPPRFALGAGWDALRKMFSRDSNQPETFASVLERGLGPTICREFYFPYARKIWGLEPDQLSATQARRRVAANSPAKMLRKISAALPGLGKPGSGRFFYPRRGYGQISECLFESAKRGGAEFIFGVRVTGIDCEQGSVQAVSFEQRGETRRMPSHHIWSTLPITVTARAMTPEAPAEILSAASAMSFRGLILIYLALERDRFSEYDAHYFPETEIPISRLSEPKNYSGVSEPRGRTVLCAELPCDDGSAEWKMSDDELADVVTESMAKAGLSVDSKIQAKVTRRLRFAYPIYSLGYEEHFQKLDDWLAEMDGLLTFGRQGLFAHDNTHHALYMADAAAKCFDETGRFDRQRWMSFREVFESHVVED